MTAEHAEAYMEILEDELEKQHNLIVQCEDYLDGIWVSSETWANLCRAIKGEPT